jgi:hypothetical protein
MNSGSFSPGFWKKNIMKPGFIVVFHLIHVLDLFVANFVVSPLLFIVMHCH